MSIFHDLKLAFFRTVCLISGLCMSIVLSAQVSQIQYQLKFNVDSCRYEVFLIVQNGEAITPENRLLNASEVSLVLPAGIIISDIKGQMPLFGNEFYGGSEPAEWNIYYAVNSPTVNPLFDYYMFSPFYDDDLHFNDLNTGDTILLFSFIVDNITHCGEDFRLFMVGTDPAPDDPGMGGIDLSQGFRIGSGSNIFTGNADPVYPPKPVVIDSLIASCNSGIEIQLTVNEPLCQSPFTYQWTGPNSFNSTNQDVFISPATSSHSGIYKVIISNAFGCIDSLSVLAYNKPNAGNDFVVCAGSAIQLSGTQPDTGLWTAAFENSGGAILGMSSGGMADVEFDAMAGGWYSFIYTFENCSDTMQVLVNSTPLSGITAESSICVGNTTQLSPVTGGFWISNNPTIASVTSAGVVSGLSDGITNFTFTSFASGCSSTTPNITVNPNPVAINEGTPEICIGSTTTLSPSTNGEWTSSDPLIASVSNEGLVSGISSGSVQLLYTNSFTGCMSDFIDLNVTPKPISSITGSQNICISNTTQLYPLSGGTWTSLSPAIANVTDGGLVTALNTGSVSFVWTQSSTGCISDTTDLVNILPGPNVVMNATTLCIGASLLLSPNSGGTWSSSNTSVAIIGASSGLVSGINPGKAVFTFTRQSDGCYSTTDSLIINPRPELSSDSNPICVGSTTNLYPSTNGTWSSLDEEIAIVLGNTVIGIGSGIVLLSYTDNATGCGNTMFFNVTERAVASFSDSDSICIGEITQLSPSTGGTWSSSNNAVATVNNAGVVNGISSGNATFIFTESTTGCNSLPSNPLTVHPRPAVGITGDSSICIGSATTLFPDSGGIWTSNDESIAIVNPSTGQVTAINSGIVSFSFTSSSTGCTSFPTNPVTVLAEPNAVITGNTILCIGSITTLSPNTGGFWVSNNPAVATVTNEGIVTALGTGDVNFTFTETVEGCGYESTTEILTVTPCFNPDFNATLISVPVSGNLNTNDLSVLNSTYSNMPVLLSAPSSSTPMMNMNSDGSYTFESNISGKYVYEIEVCVAPMVSDCPSSSLRITVKDYLETNKTVMANPDLTATYINTPVMIPALENDVCILVGGCSLDAQSVAIVSGPTNGTVNINLLNGNIQYTPNMDYTGLDWIIYKVCATDEDNNCDTSRINITIKSIEAENSVVAVDDIFITGRESLVSGNILVNDYDPESNILLVTPQNTTGSAGDFVLNSDGSFTFSPAIGFVGPVHFIYEVCDNHSLSACANATIYMLVLPDLTLNIRVYLEGALSGNGNATAEGRPLMKDNLRVSPFNGTNYIPVSDPYSIPTIYSDITYAYTHFGPGNKIEFQSIFNPTTVFSVSGQNAIVDWVFVELRNKNDNTQIVASRSGLLQRDGDVTDVDGVGSLRFPDVIMDEYFIVIRHRNHLGAMSRFPVQPLQMTEMFDFTSPLTPVFDFGTSQGNGIDYTGLAQNIDVKPGYNALWGGDFDQSKKVKFGNPNDDLNNLFFDVLFYPNNLAGSANYDFAIGYFQGDYDMNSKAKFDNPNDDKNYLLGQILFYPLNLNFLSNFDFFIEQVP